MIVRASTSDWWQCLACGIGGTMLAGAVCLVTQRGHETVPVKGVLLEYLVVGPWSMGLSRDNWPKNGERNAHHEAGSGLFITSERRVSPLRLEDL